MSQINLLKQPSSSRTQFNPKLLESVLIIVLVGLIVYYGYLYFQSKATDSKIAYVQIQISQETQQALANPKREELITRQEQLKNLSTLISGHVYWSQILPALASSTLTSASYSNLQINSDGTLALSASVPSLRDLDTYLQVFDLPQVNKYFSNVKISSFSTVQKLNASSVQFQVTMNYNPSLIQYIPPANANKAASN